MASTATSPSVAVVVPIFSEVLTANEETSLRHLFHFLEHYPKIALVPQDLDTLPAGPLRRLDLEREHFHSRDHYSRLLLSPDFYRLFEAYEFILVYQLDCLVFDDHLGDFCALEHDYIGAPWLVDSEHPELGFSRVGNGGLSLRRVRACIDTLESRTRWWSRFRGLATLPDLRGLNGLSRLRKSLRVGREVARGVEWYRTQYSLNEDHFWSDRARLFNASFRVAPIETALRFSFEAAPRSCWERNGGRLPFGCHGWERYDRDFWSPFLLSAGSRPLTVLEPVEDG